MRVFNQKRSGDPNPQYFSESTAVQMGGVLPAIQMGGVLQYKWEAYCRISLSSKLRSQEGTAIQMGGVLPYKLEAYCRTFAETSRGWGFRNSAHSRLFTSYECNLQGCRVVLPEELISITETDLWNVGRASLATDTDSPWDSTLYPLQLQIWVLKQTHSET